MEVPELALAHVSDPHFLAPTHPDQPRTAARLAGVLAAIERRQQPPAAIVVTGDLTESGDPGAYAALRDQVLPVAAELGSEVMWVPGNHDERSAFTATLLGTADTDNVFQVLNLSGLRIIGLDTTVPGHHHGALPAATLAALRAELATPAPKGTILALHHPPLPPVMDFMHGMMLRDPDPLAAAIASTDVRWLLAGHVHSACTGWFAGVPVTTASAPSRAVDLAQPTWRLIDRDGPVSYNHVAVYPHTITSSVVAVGEWPALPPATP